MRRLAIGVLPALLASALAAPDARADAAADAAKLRCVEDNTNAQDARRGGDLAAARRHLRSCAQAPCPALVREDCEARLIELDNLRPSVVFEVTDGGGKALREWRVSVDGEPAASALGVPVQVEPGRHVFTIEVPGRAAVQAELLLHDDGVQRHERVVVPEPTAPPAPEEVERPAAPPAAPASSESPAPPSSRRHKVGLVLLGVGAVGVGTGAVFGWAATSEWQDAKSACGGAPVRCTNAPAGQSHRANALRDATISTVAAVGGTALLAAGAFALFGERAAANGTTLAPSVAAHEVGVSAVRSW
jgi:hypothetical protein